MTPLEVYQLYIALKCHFYNGRDFFKYGKSPKNASEKSLDRRNDRAFFFKMAKEYTDKEIQHLMLANFSSSNSWVGDLQEQEAKDIWKDWERKRQSFSYLFSQELDLLEKGDFNTKGEHPPLLTKFLQKKISAETMCIIDILSDIVKYWDSRIEEKYIWPEARRRIVKYRPFVERLFDIEKCKKIAESRFS